MLQACRRFYSRSLRRGFPAKTNSFLLVCEIPLQKGARTLLQSLCGYDTVLPRCASSFWGPERPAPISHTCWYVRAMRSPGVTGTSRPPIASWVKKVKFQWFSGTHENTGEMVPLPAADSYSTVQ